jgi:hypothetical protein
MENPGLQNKAAIPVDVKTNQTWLPSNPSTMPQALPAKPSDALFATPHKMHSRRVVCGAYLSSTERISTMFERTRNT